MTICIWNGHFAREDWSGTVKGQGTRIIDVPVDRSTVLGNPYKMDPADGNATRDAVCDKYAAYFDKVLRCDPALADEFSWCDARFCRRFKARLDWIEGLLRDGRIVALGCWCSPARCHAEKIRDYFCRLLPSVKVISCQELNAMLEKDG